MGTRACFVMLLVSIGVIEVLTLLINSILFSLAPSEVVLFDIDPQKLDYFVIDYLMIVHFFEYDRWN